MRKMKALFLILAGLSAGAVLVIHIGIRSPSPLKAIATTTTQSLQRELSYVDQEAAAILQHVGDESAWEKLIYSFYLIRGEDVVLWNQNEFLPDVAWVSDDFETKLIRLPAGDFLIRKWKISGNEFLIAVIPLHVSYKISNRYLAPNWNQRIFNTPDLLLREPEMEIGEPVQLKNGEVIFRISLTSEHPQIYSSLNIILLIVTLVSIGSLSGFFFCWFAEAHHQKNYERALFILTGSLVGLRIAMLVLDLPQAFTTSAVFDPAFFASSVYNPSLGDLVLNALAVTLVMGYIFLFYRRFSWLNRLQEKSETLMWMLSIFFSLAALFSFLFPFLFIETISNNSAIVLDISQSLSFDLLRYLAYFSLLLGTIAGFAGAHFFFRMAVSLVSRNRFLIAYGIALMIFCIYFLVAGRNYWVTVAVGSCYFLILTWTQLHTYITRISLRSSFYFFLIALAFSIQTAFSLKHFVEAGQRRSQLRFGNNFLVSRDILGEYLLHESTSRIAEDPLIQSRFANPLLGRGIIRDKINQIYLSSYFDRYDVRIYLYGSGGQPLDNVSRPDFASYINALQVNADQTEYDQIYRVKDDDLQATKRYLAVIPVNYHHVTGGFVVLDLSLKRIIPENVYPELLLDNRFSQYAVSKDFSYAFISQKGILSSFGNFNYDKYFTLNTLNNQNLFTSGITLNGFNHVGIEDDSGRTAVISAPAYSYFFLLTNIAFFFVLNLLLFFLILAGYGLITFFRKEPLNYSARIQLYIYLAFLFPLVVVSVTTLSLTARSAQEQLTAGFSEKSSLLAERIVSSLSDSIAQRGQIENQLTNFARLMNVDATLYDTRGNRLASTQPLIFENHLLSDKMNREAWRSIVLNKERSFIGNEHIGLLQYSASYVAIKSPESGKLLGIIDLPFFDSASSLERNQTIVFANIIDIFFVVFILFSILSFFAADELTFPLRLITRTLRSTTLIGENKRIVWKANDEIGLMVTEYNRMVENLEASKVELARSQKESAWREIARQVAHEINNPLTPMKLTLQQMDRNLASGNLTAEKTSQSIRTLLEQVDILNEIASSFSAFARMPAPLLQRIELGAILRKVTELHASEAAGEISLHHGSDPVYVLGDARLLNRIFSNIILNAIQSGKEGEEVKVSIGIKQENDFCLISFQDNGRGISMELREKIFLPHFTTKKTGSGIGLAIARQGIEQSGGGIWFESAEGQGTTFFIRLPRVI